ncbi:MAG: hypothetical protein ACLQU1_08265 [Bryobacteraceae bacterium]
MRWCGSKLVNGSSLSCGCWRADPDVRQAARMTNAGAGARGDRCPAALPAATARCAVGGGQATAGRERTSARRRRLLRSLPGTTAGRQAGPFAPA